METAHYLFIECPALVTIILAYIWFGLVESAAILAVVINKFPVVVITMREGAHNIDNDLIDVARVFALPKHRLFLKVYLPQLYPYIMTSARNGLSLIWKIVLVVELLGRSDGIGFALHSFSVFDIASILAYTFAFVIVIFVIEALAFSHWIRWSHVVANLAISLCLFRFTDHRIHALVDELFSDRHCWTLWLWQNHVTQSMLQ